jgi:hypothetical protein
MDSLDTDQIQTSGSHSLVEQILVAIRRLYVSVIGFLRRALYDSKIARRNSTTTTGVVQKEGRPTSKDEPQQRFGWEECLVNARGRH